MALKPRPGVRGAPVFVWMVLPLCGRSCVFALASVLELLFLFTYSSCVVSCHLYRSRTSIYLCYVCHINVVLYYILFVPSFGTAN